MLNPPPRRGEVWYAHTPGQPDDPHQPRPVLVVSTDARNRHADDAIAVPLFSRGALGPTRVALDSGIGGVGHASVLFCEEITTLDHDFFRHGPLGPRVPEALLSQVVRSVRRALGEVVPEP
ncbi:MAG TPA: type II toxin-antitoxin system PemK/MazF family toxin [Chloroflexota bacterium]